jgi:hypothetical protein
MSGCTDFKRTSWSRRQLLTAGVGGFGALALPQILWADEVVKKAKAKHLIFLHQFGGPSHIDTFDLKPNAPDNVRGEFKGIPTSVPGIQVCEHLPRWAKVMHHFAQFRSVHHRMSNHNPATYYSLTGRTPPLDDIRIRDTLDLQPMYGSVVAKFKPSDDPAIPSSVAFPHLLRDGSVTPGQHASFLGKAYDPFFVQSDPNSPDFKLPELSLPADVPIERLQQRRKLLEAFDRQARLSETSEAARGMDRFNERAMAMLASTKVRDAFDLSKEKPELRDKYGRTTYGQSCLLARRLIEAGVRATTVYFSSSIGGPDKGGWDTHNDNFNALKKRLLPITDQVVPTLIEDLHQRGLLSETLVVWMGEFGRTPKIGDRDAKGRSHWPHCYTVMMAGGGLRGGAVWGASDRRGAYPAENATKLEDIAATMFWALGIDPASEVRDAVGRPVPLAYGSPVTQVFG